MLSDVVAYRYTLYRQSSGNIFIIDLPKGTVNRFLNSRHSNYEFPTIRAAFTTSDSGQYKTTLGEKPITKVLL